VLGTRKKRSASGSSSSQEVELELDLLSHSGETWRNGNKSSIPAQNPILKFKAKKFNLVVLECNLGVGSAAEALRT
jgi:hypothetical protein